MRVVAHKNDGNGLISNPIILISESTIVTAEKILEAIPANLNPVIIDDSSLPDHAYVTAWSLVNGVVEIDIEAAKNVVRNKIKVLRLPKLAALDVEFQRALETGSSTVDIVAKKQSLRDATENPAIVAATTTAELDALLKTFIAS